MQLISLWFAPTDKNEDQAATETFNFEMTGINGTDSELGAVDVETTVFYEIVDGTAVNSLTDSDPLTGNDYTAALTGSVVFPAGNNNNQTITVDIISDATDRLVERNETFTVRITDIVTGTDTSVQDDDDKTGGTVEVLERLNSVFGDGNNVTVNSGEGTDPANDDPNEDTYTITNDDFADIVVRPTNMGDDAVDEDETSTSVTIDLLMNGDLVAVESGFRY